MIQIDNLIEWGIVGQVPLILFVLLFFHSGTNHQWFHMFHSSVMWQEKKKCTDRQQFDVNIVGVWILKNKQTNKQKPQTNDLQLSVKPQA